LWLFEASPCRAAPRGQPSSPVQPEACASSWHNLLMPFGFHLTMDTLPSGVLRNDGFRFTLVCFRLSLSCPFRLLHTFLSLRPARRYPLVRIRRSSSVRQRDLNPPEQRAVQRTLRVGPSQCPALVLSPRSFGRLSFSLIIGATGSCSSVPSPASDSRPLYAGRHPLSNQVPSGFSPRQELRAWFRRH
jgi:hypothetical protein